jgi:nitrite reductase (NO-forming)
MTTTPTAPPTRSSGDGWAIVSATLAVFALVVAGIALVANTNGGTTVEVAGAATVYDGPPLEVDVELGDLYIDPAVVEVEAGRRIVLHVTNAGAMPHDLALETGESTTMLDSGASETIEVAGLSSTTLGWCTVAGHRAGGMEMRFDVIGSEAEPTAATAVADHGGHATLGANPQWDADFVPFDPTLSPASGGVEHELTLRATETQMEVAPGVFQEVWTFDDQVPGPILRGTVGDLFTITLVNEGEIGHSIDLPRLTGGVERPDAHHRPGRVTRLPVPRRARRDLHVPLRYRPGTAPHRQRHVRCDHHRSP